MNEIKINYTTNGIHAGALYKLGENAHLYLTNPQGSCNPLDNPQFKKVFENAKTIAFTYFREKADGLIPLDSFEARESQAITIFTLKDLPLLAFMVREHLSLEEVEKFNKKLLQFPLFSHRLVDNFEDEDPYKVFVVRLLRRFANMTMAQKDMREEMDHMLILESEKSSKNIVSLLSTKESDLKLLNFKKMFEIPNLFTLLKNELFPKDGIADLKIYSKELGKAWDLGAVSPSIHVPYCSDERAEKCVKQQMEEFNCDEKELYAITKKIIKKTEKMTIFDAVRTAEKIGLLIEQEKDVLILQRQHGYEELLLALSQKKIEIIGPIREDLNPRGFLFEIKKVDKVVGYFLGSIHITPNWILENFNSKIREAFEACNVLGVEVDVTREDAKEVLKGVSDYEILDEYIPIMKGIVAVGLKDVQEELDETDDKTYIRKGLELISKKLQNQYGIESGIDFAFIEKAKKRNMPVKDLESIETHKEFGELMKAEKVDFMAQLKGVSFEEIYTRFKNSIVKEICERYPLILETGYIKALENSLIRDSKAMKEAMYRRNLEMCMKTDKLIRKKMIPFSIAGAAHFAGDKSMIEIMRNLGYTVTQIICEEPKGT